MAANDIVMNVVVNTLGAIGALSDLKFGMQAVADVLTDVYDVAREGADIIGGDTLRAYEDFDQALQRLEDSGKSFIAEALEPAIVGANLYIETQENLNFLLEEGIITQEEYNFLVHDAARSTVILGESIAEMADEARKGDTAVANLSDELREAAEAVESFDRALTGLPQSDVNAALLTQRMLADEAKEAWGQLAQQISGPVGRSNERFAEQQATLEEQIVGFQEEIALLGGLDYISPEQQEQILALRSELIGVTMEILDIEEAYGDAFDSGNTGRKVTEAKDRLEELREKAWELEQQIIDLGSKPYVSAGDLARIDELQTALGDTQEAIGELSEAQEEANARLLFNMVQQQLAADGLTTAEVEALNDLALSWGLIDQATKDAQDAVLIAMDALANDPNSEAWLLILQNALGIVNGLTGTHNINFQVTGLDELPFIPVDGATYDAVTTGGGRASGGPVGSGVPYMVGEFGPEMFVPNQSGTIVPTQNIDVAAPQVVVMLDGEQIGAHVLTGAGAAARMARSAGSGLAGI